MNSLLHRFKVGSLFQIVPRATSAATSNLQISSEKFLLNQRAMSNQAIIEKFKLPERYQGSKPSVW